MDKKGISSTELLFETMQSTIRSAQPSRDLYDWPYKPLDREVCNPSIEPIERISHEYREKMNEELKEYEHQRGKIFDSFKKTASVFMNSLYLKEVEIPDEELPIWEKRYKVPVTYRGSNLLPIKRCIIKQHTDRDWCYSRFAACTRCGIYNSFQREFLLEVVKKGLIFTRVIESHMFISTLTAVEKAEFLEEKRKEYRCGKRIKIRIYAMDLMVDHGNVAFRKKQQLY